MSSHTYWANLYQRFKNMALCLDIERTSWNGPISIVGVYKPQDGEIVVDHFIKGDNLTMVNLRQRFLGCKLLITYNGLAYDVPVINRDFPGALPDDVKVLDIFLIAKLRNLKTNLKVLENTLSINRSDVGKNQEGMTFQLWKRYEHGDQEALMKLLEYNRQDVINLYPIVEELLLKII